MSDTMPPGPIRGDDPVTSDASLLRRYLAGEGDAATDLYQRYANRLLSLATVQASGDLKQRIDPEDIVQSVFRTFFRRAALGQYEVPDGEELWKLLLVIGLNKVRAVGAHHKAARRDVRQTAGGKQFDAATDAMAGQDDLALRALQLTIDELLAPLPGPYRDVIRLRFEGHEVADIADRTGRARRSVERILQEIRQRLQGLIHDAP